MARIKLELSPAAYQRLVEEALRERRPVDWQAEVMLTRALGLPFPETDGPSRDDSDHPETVVRAT